MAAVFEVQKINKKLGDQTILKDISFSIQAGECYGLLGFDGAGKSTLLNISYGQVLPNSGEIFILGLNTKSSIEMIKRKVGHLPQKNTNLDPELSVFENLLSYSWYFDLSAKFSSEKIEFLLNEFKLNSFRDSLIEELTPFAKRKLSLAKSILHEPEFLILDEPTRDLDSYSKQWFWSFIRSFRNSGKSSLLVTQCPEEASILCDKVAILDEGTLLNIGKPEKLIQDHIGAFLVEFSVKSDELNYFTKKFHNLGKSIYTNKNIISIGFENEKEARELILQINSDNLSIRRPTLNDLFLQISGETHSSSHELRKQI